MKKNKHFIPGSLLLLLSYFLSMPPLLGADLTLPTGGMVSIELISSNAAFRNTLSVASPTASVAITGCQLEPAGGLGGVQILSEKISQRGCRVTLDADPATPGIQGFAAGTTLRFNMCAQTDADPECEFIWSSDPALNSDSFDHVATTQLFAADYPAGIFRMAWEDQPGGGDSDFDDLIVVARANVDTDGDGLWDDWEQFGIDTNGDGTIDLDLPALGANRMHKDIFLEIDSMDCAVAGGDCAAGDTHSHGPKAAAINAVIQAFASAPVPNPDGVPGIALHVEVSNALAHQSFLAIGCGFGGPGIGSFDAVKADPANFGPINPRRFAYHYALFGHRQAAATTSSGCGELPGNDFLVTLGEWNTGCIGRGPNGVLDTVPAGDDLAVGTVLYTGPDLVCNSAAAGDDVQWVAVGSSPTADLDGDGLDDRTVGTVQQQAGTLMHEFGHNLQLCHGGVFDSPSFTQCNANFKPNYLSIMSYAFQMRGIPPTDPDGAGSLTARVDYSGMALADLDEANLSEPAGIGDGTDNTRYFCPTGTQTLGAGTGAIDWNCNSNLTETGIAADINGDGGFGPLTGFNDWINLRYDFQATSDFEDGVHLTTTNIVEMDYPMHLQIPVLARIDIKPGEFPNSVNPRSSGKLPVAILSTQNFNAATEVDRGSLTFGSAGNESSLASCDADPADVNGDGLLDLLCRFHTEAAGFRTESTQGLLRGQTAGGAAFSGTDSVRIVPEKP